MKGHAARAAEALLSTRAGRAASEAFLVVVFPLAWTVRYWRAVTRDRR